MSGNETCVAAPTLESLMKRLDAAAAAFLAALDSDRDAARAARETANLRSRAATEFSNARDELVKLTNTMLGRSPCRPA